MRTRARERIWIDLPRFRSLERGNEGVEYLRMELLLDDFLHRG